VCEAAGCCGKSWTVVVIDELEEAGCLNFEEMMDGEEGSWLVISGGLW
jgi:DNA-binding HxlR family transcriptional regulator